MEITECPDCGADVKWYDAQNKDKKECENCNGQFHPCVSQEGCIMKYEDGMWVCDDHDSTYMTNEL